MSAITFALGAGALAVVAALALIWKIGKAPDGNEKMQEIAHAIQTGAKAYLNRQYKTVALVAIVIAIFLGYFLGLTTMAGFVIGAFASALAGYIGMNMSVRANVKTAEAAKSGLKQALGLAFEGGTVTGLLVVGLALISVSGFYAITHDVRALIGLGFGEA